MTLVLADHPPTLLAFLCLLDLEHGVPFGFVTVALAAHLAAQGADAASIGGLIAMAMLPWSFKWAWGAGRLFRLLGRVGPQAAG